MYARIHIICTHPTYIHTYVHTYNLYMSYIVKHYITLTYMCLAYEKSVVQWAPDADANLCMTCGKSFSLTRRRHHCRLCGRILCNKCSHFLPYNLASKSVRRRVLH